MDYNNNTKLVIDALLMAIKNKPKQQKVLPHSDQGLTYRACEYLKSFKANNITESMSRKGECHDNTVAERFFNTLKTELINQQTYQNRREVSSVLPTIFLYQ
jgi:putative transposase